MTEETTSEIIFLDDNGNVVPKAQATQARILEYDASGERVRETYLVKQEEDEGEEVNTT